MTGKNECAGIVRAIFGRLLKDAENEWDYARIDYYQREQEWWLNHLIKSEEVTIEYWVEEA